MLWVEVKKNVENYVTIEALVRKTVVTDWLE